MDPESGGMDIWDVAMPLDVDMRVYNGNETAAREFRLAQRLGSPSFRTAQIGRDIEIEIHRRIVGVGIGAC